jgi:hypothetical protein
MKNKTGEKPKGHNGREIYTVEIRKNTKDQ